ncbi:MAG: sensor histidine kinase [Acidimicrobiales bacterium]
MAVDNGRVAEPSPEALRDVLRRLAAETDPPTLTVRMLQGAEELFGAASGLCAVWTNGSVRVAQFRGMGRDRLVDASRHADFRSFLSGDEPRVDRPSHPVVAMLAAAGEVAVGLPLLGGGRRLGHLVLFVGAEPSAADRALMEAYASHAAVCLLAAQLSASSEDHEQRLASLAHAVAQPVVLVDERGCLVGANGAAAGVFHLAPGFEQGHPVAGRLGHPVLERMLASGRETGAEVVIGTDEPRVYRATVRRLRGADGRVTGRALVLHDVTGERQAEALKDDLVAVVGHELRTPVTVVKGYVQTLARRGESMSAERRAQALGAVAVNVARLERVIEDLLFLSAVQDRPADLDVRSSDLARMLDRFAGERVEVRAPDRPVEVAVDEERLDKVVGHLVANALEYSEGRVVIELADRGDAVEVSVSDEGPGIFSGDLPHLFERFRQLDGSATRAHGGLGIGLYLCRRVVEALGGRIWCESRLGVGSRFTFSLPRTAALAPVP